MIVYIPTPITSVEQAEQLPIGTVATTADVYQVSRKIEDDGAWQRPDLVDDLGWDEDMVGWTALVPIEAEEEFGSSRPRGGPWEYVDRAQAEWDAKNYARDGGYVPVVVSRYITQWEPVSGPSPDRRGDCA